MASDRRWVLLDEAKPRLLDAFASTGVTRIEVVAAFPELDGIGIWLCTATDRDRNALAPNVDIAEIRRVLLGVGFDSAQLSDLSTTVQSQETVDRDYEGSWFSAMR